MKGEVGLKVGQKTQSIKGFEKVRRLFKGDIYKAAKLKVRLSDPDPVDGVIMDTAELEDDHVQPTDENYIREAEELKSELEQLRKVVLDASSMPVMTLMSTATSMNSSMLELMNRNSSGGFANAVEARAALIGIVTAKVLEAFPTEHLNIAGQFIDDIVRNDKLVIFAENPLVSELAAYKRGLNFLHNLRTATALHAIGFLGGQCFTMASTEGTNTQASTRLQNIRPTFSFLFCSKRFSFDK